MQGSEGQVAGFRDAQRRFDGLDVAHFSGEPDVGVFTKRGAQRIGKGVRVGVDCALIHQALLVIVKKFDGVLDGDHVLFTFAIDLVEHGGERSGVAGTRRSGYEDEPAGLVTQAVYDQRQSESVKAFDFPGNGTENGADGAPLIENVAAEARQVFQTEGEVQLQILFEAMFLRIRQNAISKRLGVRCRQWRHIERPQAAMNAHPRRTVRRDVKVAAPHLDHLLQQFAKRNSSHYSPSILYKTVSRRTSSMVVCPSATFIKPLRRRVIMPCSIAFFFNSRADAPTRINSRSSSLISMTS